MRAIPLIVGGMILVGSALAGDLPIAPPSPMVDPYGGTTLVKAPLAQTLKLGGLSLGLGTSDIASVPARIGKGIVREAPGSGMYRYVCYDVVKTQQRVWLAATDEMGDGRSVDMVTVMRLDSSSAHSSSCPEIQGESAVVDDFIAIGTPRNDLIKHLGQPSKTTGPWMVYNGSGHNSRQSVTVRMEQDKVAFLYAANTSTD